MTLDTAASILARIAGGKVRTYSTFDFGRQKDPANRSALVDPDEADEALEDLRGLLEHPDDFLVFMGTSLWADDPDLELVELVVAPHPETADTADVPEVEPGQPSADLNAIHVARTTPTTTDRAGLIKTLAEIDEAHGIDLFSAEADCLAIEFLTLPDDVLLLAEFLAELAPDLLHDMELTDFAETLAASRVVGLSWSEPSDDPE